MCLLCQSSICLSLKPPRPPTDCSPMPSPQEAIQLDGEILYALLRRVSPAAHRHLKKHKLEPILYMTEWFMCAFSRTLPWASVLRVWDMFLCEGEILHLYNNYGQIILLKLTSCLHRVYNEKRFFRNS